MANGFVETDCTGRDCGFGVLGEVGCTNGGSCYRAEMLEANESKFHDAALIKATRKINEALAEIPPDKDGRQLSFLQMRMGTMLAWVRHDMEVPPHAIKADSPDDDLIKALGIVRPPSAK